MNRLHILCIVLLASSQCIHTREELAMKNINDDRSLLPRTLTNITAGNSFCRADNVCGYHQNAAYSWCYTDSSWDYCCIGPCTIHPQGNNMQCNVGNKIKRCGDGGVTTIDGKACSPKHPCGLHGDDYDFWCYKYYKSDWDYCCSPLSKCSKKGQKYKCDVSYSLPNSWREKKTRECQPEQHLEREMN
ncbi:hypothetical protein CHS0354_015224 [Potamilus streckersoni]|uniref:Uncharacterized protein n=1 Tax=Potamilus streckersoni TaxID=2493646 RepID=A0AAE0VIJ7_9BIVA|nr:hypothetical protein CHS0354_015224 [Potamilus streckersoni]